LPLLLLTTSALAADRFPPPEFQTDYQRPLTTTPAARAIWWDYADVALLAGALAAGGFMALKYRRRWPILILAIASLAYFGFVRKGCVCPIGAIQNAALGLADSAYVVPAVVIAFLLLPILASLFVGRVFCGGVCPLGAIQDIFVLKPLKVPAWLEHALGLVAYAYLGFAVLLAATGSGFVVCRYDPFVAFFRLGGSFPMLALGGCLLVIGLFVGRPYCRFICPLGAIFRGTSRLARHRVTITPDNCIKCRLCENACPFGAILPPTTTQTPLPRNFGKRKLLALVVLTPLLMAGGGLLVSRLAGPLSMVHPVTRQAAMISQIAQTPWLKSWARQDVGEGEMARGDLGTLARRGELNTFTLLYDCYDPRELQQAKQAIIFDGGLTGGQKTTVLSQAAAIRTHIVWGGWILGGFLGLVVGGKLISLTVRRRRDGYQPDPSKCLACGRCFEYCPIERQRRGTGVPPVSSPARRGREQPAETPFGSEPQGPRHGHDAHATPGEGGNVHE
jgi:ferredoxin